MVVVVVPIARRVSAAFQELDQRRQWGLTPNQPNIFEEPDSFGTSSNQETPAEGNVFGNIFDAPSGTETQETTETDKTEEKEEDTPEVVPY